VEETKKSEIVIKVRPAGEADGDAERDRDG